MIGVLSVLRVYVRIYSPINTIKMRTKKNSGTGILSIILSVLLIVSVSGCKKEPAPVRELKFEVVSETVADSPHFLVPGNLCKLEYKAENLVSVKIEGLPDGWSAELSEQENIINVAASEGSVSKAQINITAVGDGNQSIVNSVVFYCLNSFDDPDGVFVLNEGNMTTENGSLTYITPEGYVVDDAYSLINGTELGNVAQDMAFCDGKIYVISQNGDTNPTGTTFENDGMLVIMDAVTLKKVAAFKREDLSVLDWPTHIAVLDAKHVYIRDNKGVYRLDSETGALTFVSGSEKAPKARFSVADGKVYTFYNKSYMTGLLEITADKDEVTKIPLPNSAPYKSLFSVSVLDGGNVWLTASGFGKNYVGKYNIADGKLVSRQISVEPNTGSAGVSFGVFGNEIYYANGTMVYSMTFDADSELKPESGLDAEKNLCDLNSIDSNAGLMYNGLAVHPVTGMVYVNTIKSYANFTQNQIWKFDFKASADAPAAKYENYTNFPAGFYFPVKK